MNPVEGGDEFVMPANIFGKQDDEDVAEEDDDQSPVPDSDDEPADDRGQSQVYLKQREAQRQLLKSSLARMTKRIALHARKATKTPAKFGEWLESFEESHRDVVRESVHEVVATIFVEDAHARTDTIVATMFNALRTDLNTEYSTRTEREFAAAVDKRMMYYETRWPEIEVDRQWTVTT
jgi:hypothetical protein